MNGEAETKQHESLKGFKLDYEPFRETKKDIRNIWPDVRTHWMRCMDAISTLAGKATRTVRTTTVDKRVRTANRRNGNN